MFFNVNVEDILIWSLVAVAVFVFVSIIIINVYANHIRREIDTQEAHDLEESLEFSSETSIQDIDIKTDDQILQTEELEFDGETVEMETIRKKDVNNNDSLDTETFGLGVDFQEEVKVDNKKLNAELIYVFEKSQDGTDEVQEVTKLI